VPQPDQVDWLLQKFVTKTSAYKGSHVDGYRSETGAPTAASRDLHVHLTVRLERGHASIMLSSYCRWGCWHVMLCLGEPPSRAMRVADVAQGRRHRSRATAEPRGGG